MRIVSRFRQTAWQVRDNVQRELYLRRVARGHRRFDVVLGTDTAGIVEPEVEAKGDPAAHLAHHYEAVNESGFRAMVESLAPDPSQYAFFDIGSGKGKALILAARYPFQKVRGVEFDAAMHSAAALNIERATGYMDVRCADVKSMVMDASKFDAYADKSFVLFFNSFGGEVLARFAERLEHHAQARDSEIILAYLNPTEPQHFDESPHLDVLVRTNRLIVYGTNGVELEAHSRRRLAEHYSGWNYVAGDFE